jgi:hypothetical protein
MNIPISIVVLFLGAWLAVQGWTIRELIYLKTKVASLAQSLKNLQERRYQ